MEKLREKLIGLGLKEKEADVYLAVLSFKKSTVTDINKKSGITRTNVYQYLESLLRKELICKTVSGKRLYYRAENPRNIISYLNKEKVEIERKKEKIEKIIPELKTIFNESMERPSVKFYEGKDGIK